MSTKRIALVTGFVFLLLSVRLFELQIILGERFSQLSRANSIRVLRFRGARGRIFDRDGRIIADNRISYNLLIYPQNIDNPDNFLKKLSEILDIPISELKKNFYKQNISSALPIVLIEHLDKKKAIIIEEMKFQLPAVAVESVPKRYYPYERLASHILGYLSYIDWWRLNKWKEYGYSAEDLVGYGGVEERYDYYLRPQDGGLQLEVDNRGRLRRILGFKPPRNGKDIHLTIDLRIQKIVEDSLKSFSGAIIIMQPYTGEIIALASAPDFSPQDISFSSAVLKRLLSDPSAPLINRAISGLYPPASVFKTIVAVAGLQNKRIDAKTSFLCDGMMKIGNRQFGCWDKHGYQNLYQAIVHSCDIFFYRLGLLLGADKISEYALKFGLGKPTQIDLPEEKIGFVPHPFFKKIRQGIPWFEGDTANFSIGQGDLLVTPLQTLRMISVFANKGKLVRPYIVKSIDAKDISVYQRSFISVNIEEKTLDLIHRAMQAVVNEPTGTAHTIHMSSISVAGKTGTAQVAKKQPHAWFVGYFPAENPRYSICVFLEHAGSSAVACEVTKSIIKRMLEESLI